eukprot:TRINITY_DN74989_c0_g1_i1.p1 TRINITY_DN74989_c0_g1~~TRINITY_DN74989_c0_g1_i1.p1  ORF type:complete len:109 (+),score=1.79 TRINITY_DN74989_c0_g1_i1:206-532(+)
MLATLLSVKRQQLFWNSGWCGGEHSRSQRESTVFLQGLPHCRLAPFRMASFWPGVLFALLPTVSLHLLDVDSCRSVGEIRPSSREQLAKMDSCCDRLVQVQLQRQDLK